MEPELIWKLIAGKLTGEASEEELLELNMLMAQHTKLGSDLQFLIRLWNAVKEDDRAAAACAFERHMIRLAEKDKKLYN